MIRAAIWANDTESGTRYNVTFERSYRDGENWKSTHSFGRDDLLVLAKAADLAHTWVVSQPRERPEEAADSAGRRQASFSGARFPTPTGA